VTALLLAHSNDHLKRKLGIVREHLFLENKSLAVYPLSANIL